MATTTDNLALTVPGPQPSKFFGRSANAFRFVKDSVGYTRQLFEIYGPIVSLAYGGGTNVYSPLPNCPGTVFVYGPEYVRQVATQHEVYYKYPLSARMYRKREESKRTEPLKHFTVGLFGVNSEQHRQHRQLLMPAFHKQRIESYRDDIISITQSVLNQLQVGKQYNIAEIMRLLTLRVATKTLFGEDIGEGGGNTGRLLQDALGLLGTPKVVLLPFDLPGFPYHRLLNLMTQLDDEMYAIIQHKRTVASDNQDLLSMLIQARDEESGAVLSEDELLGHASAIFAAGHDTSSNALTWTLFLLSQHPQVAADLLDELECKLKGEAPTIEQLQQLPLLERVIKESLRVLPPVPWNGRVTSSPTQLGGYTLPTGTEVFVSIYQTHHMPELYSDPEVFNPHRWETLAPNTFEYNPFSAGPRTCIGAAFAMMEIKIVLAMLLQRFHLQCAPQIKVDRIGVIVMTPKHGMPMIVHKQDHSFTGEVGQVRGNVREMVKLP